MSWDNTAPSANTLSGMTPDNTAPSANTLSGMTPDNTAPSANTLSGMTPDNTAPSANTLSGMTPDNTPPDQVFEEVFTDAFTGTEDDALAAPWSPFNSGAKYSDANQAKAGSPQGGGAKLASVAITDGYVQAKTYVDDLHELYLRASASAYLYAVLYDGNLWLSNAGGMLATVAQAIVAGAVMRIEAVGNQVRVFYNGSLKIDFTGTNAQTLYGVSGYPQFQLGANGLFDDFACGRFISDPNYGN